MKDFIKALFNLQFFAEAGTNVNATGTMTNAYTGETSTRDSSNYMAAELKDFYDTELLENARMELRYAQFGKKQNLPAHHKGTVEWRKWNTFAKASALQEGVIPTGQNFGMTNLTGSIDQYGTYTAITDKLELRAYDDIILGATEEMGASAAATQETLIRNALLTGTNVLYCDNVTSSGASTPTSSGGMFHDSTNGFAYLTPTMINKAVAIMKKNRVPKINGKYYAVVHPSVAFDLRECQGWLEAHKYAQPGEIYNGEIGELHGVRFIENVDAPVIRADNLAGTVRELVLGADLSASAVTEITYSTSGVTLAADALKDRIITINGVSAKVVSNTASSGTHKITVASTTFGAGTSGTTKIYPGEGGGLGDACYATFFFGKDSFGIIDPEGGALQMIVHDKDEIGGPLNQFSTIGYKFETNGATILYPERLLRVMSMSSFSATDDDNI